VLPRLGEVVAESGQWVVSSDHGRFARVRTHSCVWAIERRQRDGFSLNEENMRCNALNILVINAVTHGMKD